MRKIIPITMVAALLFACGGTPFKPGASWSNDEARYFDDGINIIDDLGKLEGQWRSEAEDNLEGRTKLADMVAVVTLGDIQIVQEMGGPETRRIQFTANELLYGGAPEGGTVLVSSEMSRGYTLMIRHEEELRGSKLLFVRYFKTEEGTIGHHFHLSPNSDDLVNRVKSILTERVHKERMAAQQTM